VQTEILITEGCPVAENVPDQNLDNRKLSALQRAALAFLATQGQPTPCGEGMVSIGHLPCTGDVVDALSRQRDKAGFASVSRALMRLWHRGLVDAYTGQVAARGRGFRWAAADPRSL
jgi:hypothetical protein